ncbi:hypothetical protein QYE80_32660 [Pseudomonas tohonis]|nr:hypothetical protein [Pseudomonas tohonis]
MIPDVMLGGIPLKGWSGPVSQEYSPIGGSTVVRRSGGAAVKMQHWRKMSISLRGSGWMGPGFAALDFSQPLELRCTKQLSITTTSLTGSIVGTARPDRAPWVLAFVGDDWVKYPVAMTGNAFTITEVPGATLYQVCWMPQFTVFCEPPPESMDPQANTHDWTITAEEV